MQLPLIAEIKKPASVESSVIESFGADEEEAVKESICWAWRNKRISRMTQRRAAELCGMSTSHFSNMLDKNKYLPPQKINQYEWVVGNTAVSQTIQRFREERDRQLVKQMAAVIAEHMVAA